MSPSDVIAEERSFELHDFTADHDGLHVGGTGAEDRGRDRVANESRCGERMSMMVTSACLPGVREPIWFSRRVHVLRRG